MNTDDLKERRNQLMSQISELESELEEIEVQLFAKKHPKQNPIDFITDQVEKNPKEFLKPLPPIQEWPELVAQGLTTTDKLMEAGYEPPPRAFHSARKSSYCYWCLVYGKCSDHMMIDGDEIPASARYQWGIGDIKINQVKCLLCGDHPRSIHRHDYKSCKCGNVAVDGGSQYQRVIGSSENWLNELVPYVDKS